MPRTPLAAQERRQQILHAVQAGTECSVGELAERFHVTQATVRNDLTQLELEGEVVRTYGGAVARTALQRETLPGERREQEVKGRIARKALELVADGDSIAIDTGTTEIAFARALAGSDKTGLTVICPDLDALRILEERRDFDVIAVGGRLRHGFHYGYGELALDMIARFSVDAYFASTSAVDFERGLTTPNVGTAELKRAMMGIAAATHLLADASKFNKRCLAKFADLDQIDHAVVDGAMAQKDLERLSASVRGVLVA